MNSLFMSMDQTWSLWPQRTLASFRLDRSYTWTRSLDGGGYWVAGTSIDLLSSPTTTWSLSQTMQLTWRTQCGFATHYSCSVSSGASQLLRVWLCDSLQLPRVSLAGRYSCARLPTPSEHRRILMPGPSSTHRQKSWGLVHGADWQVAT